MYIISATFVNLKKLRGIQKESKEQILVSMCTVQIKANPLCCTSENVQSFCRLRSCRMASGDVFRGSGGSSPRVNGDL